MNGKMGGRGLPQSWSGEGVPQSSLVGCPSPDWGVPLYWSGGYPCPGISSQPGLQSRTGYPLPERTWDQRSGKQPGTGVPPLNRHTPVKTWPPVVLPTNVNAVYSARIWQKTRNSRITHMTGLFLCSGREWWKLSMILKNVLLPYKSLIDTEPLSQTHHAIHIYPPNPNVENYLIGHKLEIHISQEMATVHLIMLSTLPGWDNLMKY